MNRDDFCLKGEKVNLRRLTIEEIEKIYFWNYEEENREHLKWNGPYAPLKPKEKEEFVQGYIKRLNDTEKYPVPAHLGIFTGGKFVGSVGWYWVDERTNWLENGLVIYDPAYWSGGIGTEAFWLWTDFIFRKMDVRRVGISTWSGNIRMIKLAKKIGMMEEGRIRMARIVNGQYYDSVKMGVLREEWEELRSRPPFRIQSSIGGCDE